MTRIQGYRRGWAAAVVLLTAVAGVAVQAVPASATIVPAQSVGWHAGALPFGLHCGRFETVAVGSDRLAMRARICIAPVGLGDDFVSIANFQNDSASAAVATADIYGWDDTAFSSHTTCSPRILPAHGEMFCRSRVVPVAGATGYAYGSVALNGHSRVLSDHPALDATNKAVTAAITSTAWAEYRNSAHNHEIGGYNCNYYTGQLGAGISKCTTSGFRSEEWCADFVRWVWGHAGVRTAGLTAGAASFATSSSTTYRPGGAAANAAVGDAAVARLNSSGRSAAHVMLVVAVGASTITVVEGNAGPHDQQVWTRTINPLLVGVSGYASPRMP